MPEPRPDTPCDLQTALLQLAVQAAAGSEMRRALCEAASLFPAHEVEGIWGIDPRGGISRDTLAGLLRRINIARENGDDPARSLRAMRNALERLLDLFDLVSE